MPSIFITAANPYGYAIGSTQTVTDDVARLALGDVSLRGGWGLPANTVTPRGITPQDREMAAGEGPLTPAQTSAVQALVAGARNFRASGRASSPISTFNGASASGVLGKPSDILLPANFLGDGTGQIIVRAVVRKTGTDAASYFQIHLGPSNGLADVNLFSGASNVTNFSWSATGLEVVFEATFDYKSGGFGVTNRRSREGDGSLSQQVGEFTGTYNNAVDNYLNFVISGATAGNTYDLLGYEVKAFQ